MSPALQRRLPWLATAGLFVLLFMVAGLLDPRFFSTRVFVNLFIDENVLGIVAVGMTLVIFSGGIDLSVGAVVGFTGIFIATLVMSHHVPPVLAALAAILVGALFGAGMGLLIQVFQQPPFLITLAGMFFARGVAFWFNTESVYIEHPLYQRLSIWELPLGSRLGLPPSTFVLFGTFLAGYIIAHHTRFGRNLLAIGSNEQSARLMGLPVSATKVGVYALNSALAALAGAVNTVNLGSGNPAFGVGMELDAIACVVIGGTLLTGGRGHVFGTFFGVLIIAAIQSAINFNGHLSPAWNRIVVGLLLLGFILLQRLLLRGVRKG